MIDESRIPPHLLERSRIWFAKQTDRLQQVHGDSYGKNKAWLDEYLNAELREILAKSSARISGAA